MAFGDNPRPFATMQKCNLRRKDRIDMARIATKPHSKLGRVVSKAMADTGINALTVSRAAGVHHTTLWRWRTGNGGPRSNARGHDRDTRPVEPCRGRWSVPVEHKNNLHV